MIDELGCKGAQGDNIAYYMIHGKFIKSLAF